MMMPIALNNREDGSGTGEGVAVKLPDCELVMLLPDAKSAGVQTTPGQKYSWIFWGVGAAPPGRKSVIVCEKPPV